jgi:UDPglucose 6-dehydrogenase
MPARIGFVGMTHLGLVSGVAASEKGFHTVCFDPNASRIAALNRKSLPVSEPQLEHLVAKNAERIRFSDDAAALHGCDVVYVAPDVPTDDTGQSDLASINALLDLVFDAARADAVIVVLSQVPPGYTRSRQRPGRTLYYQVETLIFGQAVERALQPERYIVGCADPALPLAPAYHGFLQAHGCPILPMRYESAELAKISINMCLVASVSTANTLAELCEKTGADWSEIVPALRLDKRIGQHAYLSPGLGIAGGNLERDLATVIRFAAEHGTDSGVVSAWQRNSAYRREWAARTLDEVVFRSDPQATVAVWGLTYKENTHSTKNSPSLATLARFPGKKFRLHDPVLEAKDEPLEAARSADALMILTPWPQYRQIAPGDIAKAMRGRIVLDPYRVLDRDAARKAGLELHTLGRAANA